MPYVCFDQLVCDYTWKFTRLSIDVRSLRFYLFETLLTEVHLIKLKNKNF